MNESRETPRSWFCGRRLHWLSWLALAASSAAMALLVLPGLPREEEPVCIEGAYPWWVVHGGEAGINYGQSKNGPLSVLELEHGWPLLFQRRALRYGLMPGGAGSARPLPAAVIESLAGWGGELALAWRGGPLPKDHRPGWLNPLAWRFDDFDVQQFHPFAALVDAVAAIGMGSDSRADTTPAAVPLPPRIAGWRKLAPSRLPRGLRPSGSHRGDCWLRTWRR